MFSLSKGTIISKTRHASKESLKNVAFRWILYCFLKLLCIFNAIRVYDLCTRGESYSKPEIKDVNGVWKPMKTYWRFVQALVVRRMSGLIAGSVDKSAPSVSKLETLFTESDTGNLTRDDKEYETGAIAPWTFIAQPTVAMPCVKIVSKPARTCWGFVRPLLVKMTWHFNISIRSAR
jgi:hypothetical protein